MEKLNVGYQNRSEIDGRLESYIVKVVIEIGGDLDLKFSCEDNPSGGSRGRSRNYTPRQQEIIDLWLEHRLNECPINSGEVVTFLKRLTRILQ